MNIYFLSSDMQVLYVVDPEKKVMRECVRLNSPVFAPFPVVKGVAPTIERVEYMDPREKDNTSQTQSVPGGAVYENIRQRSQTRYIN